MTRKDFQLIADTFAEEIATCEAMEETVSAQALRHFAASMADSLAKTNPRFDRERFVTACTRLG
jgi:hypothetical protein